MLKSQNSLQIQGILVFSKINLLISLPVVEQLLVYLRYFIRYPEREEMPSTMRIPRKNWRVFALINGLKPLILKGFSCFITSKSSY